MTSRRLSAVSLYGFLSLGIGMMLGCAHAKPIDEDLGPEVSGEMEQADAVFLADQGSNKECGGDSDCPSGEICYPQTERCMSNYPNPRMLDVSLLDKAACKVVNVYFAYDSTQIVEEAQKWLTYDVHCLQGRGVKAITLRGHADSRGTDPYNKKLSVERADAVRTMLKSAGLDIPIKIRGYGSKVPMKAGRSEKDYAFNRRVEFVILREAPATTTP